MLTTNTFSEDAGKRHAYQAPTLVLYGDALMLTASGSIGPTEASVTFGDGFTCTTRPDRETCTDRRQP